MSVKVDLDKLGQTLADFPFGYLITVGDDFRAHTVAVTPVFEDGAFTIGPLGGTTRRMRPRMSRSPMLCDRPGNRRAIHTDRRRHRRAFTDAGVRLTPRRAVLHRSAIEPGEGTRPRRPARLPAAEGLTVTRGLRRMRPNSPAAA